MDGRRGLNNKQQFNCGTNIHKKIKSSKKNPVLMVCLEVQLCEVVMSGFIMFTGFSTSSDIRFNEF